MKRYEPALLCVIRRRVGMNRKENERERETGGERK